MRRLTNLNTAKSISEGQLVFQEEWLEVFQRLVIYFGFGIMALGAAVVLFIADYSNQNDVFIAVIICPIVIICSVYIVYRKAAEKHLIEITTNFRREENKQLLIHFARDKHLDISRKSGDLLVFTMPLDGTSPEHKQSFIFIVRDQLVLFTTLKDQFRLNMPVLRSHLSMKRDLVSWFDKGNSLSAEK